MQTQATNVQLMEIVLAQDFQDLTGQVITRISDLAHRLEKELLILLLEHTPAEQRPAGGNGRLNGPVTDAELTGDVVTTQSPVDELLDSLLLDRLPSLGVLESTLAELDRYDRRLHVIARGHDDHRRCSVAFGERAPPRIRARQRHRGDARTSRE